MASRAETSERRTRNESVEREGWEGCVGRKIREFASCASDATRELTTHASYRAHYYPIYRSVYRRVFIPLGSRNDETKASLVYAECVTVLTR